MSPSLTILLPGLAGFALAAYGTAIGAEGTVLAPNAGGVSDTAHVTAQSVEPLADIAAARPDAVSVLLENDYARVLRVMLQPGESLPPHGGRTRAVFAMSDYEVAWSEVDDDSVPRRWRAGEVHAHGGRVHAIRNTGEGLADFVVFERTPEPLPQVDAGTGNDAVGADPDNARLLHQDDAFRVVRVELPPGAGQPVHGGGWRAVLSLSDYELEWREGEAAVRTVQWAAGDVHWHGPGEHAARNTGDTVATWLVVQYLR